VNWFLGFVAILTLATALGAVVGVVLLFFKRWTLAARIARASTLGALAVLGSNVGILTLLFAVPSVSETILLKLLPSGEPGQRARALAEGISEMMNCSALSVPAVLIGGLGWLIARRGIGWESARMDR
jgi:hypothetical protein